MKTYRWGILGAGGIVRRWMRGAVQTEGMEICAIGSRTLESAEKAAKELNIPKFGDYLSVVTDPEVEICYVAVPHPFHKELAELAMNHGKHVLVEKPATVTEKDWLSLCQCAKKNDVFLMEAVWTRLFPATKELKKLFTEDNLGKLKLLNCAFSGYLPDMMASHRNLLPDTAGGGLLDMGVYCLHLADFLYDAEPEQVFSLADINTDHNQFGVDEQAVIIARYPGGGVASMATGVRTAMRDTAMLYAASNSVEMPVFWKPTELRVGRTQGRQLIMETLSFPVEQKEGFAPDEGYRYEIEHVHECLSKGLTESPEITWEVSARVLRLCDKLRAEWGLVYPFEKEENA